MLHFFSSCEPFLNNYDCFFLLCLIMFWSYTIVLYCCIAFELTLCWLYTIFIIISQDPITRVWAAQRIGGGMNIMCRTPWISSREAALVGFSYLGVQTNWEECGPCPVFASYALAFALQLREEHGKTSARTAEEYQLKEMVYTVIRVILRFKLTTYFSKQNPSLICNILKFFNKI